MRGSQDTAEEKSAMTADVITLPIRTAAPRARHRRLLGYALIGSGLALVPWLYVLATGLPPTATAVHWPLAWVGLDALEAAGLVTTGLLALRHDPRRAVAATATATLLVVDAWFDTVTAAPGADFASALVMAGVELPLAGVCGAIAVHARENRSRG
ncbi:hypothetical protein [Streptomyces sp. ISL-11]|uniref:hypothetical protein n=1 Tax=Streptomyces sp. ISL-11 TaxID=2819174 RepID=UPI00203604E5|nr:hypothetical protein [Streptomyces sp. ISL-11]